MREFSRRYASDISRGKITLPQLSLLEFLFSNEHAKMTEVARSLSVTTAAATGIVGRLVRSGYITREADQFDRRVIKVCLTQKGRRWVNGIIRQREETLGEIFGQLSQEEQNDYLRIIRRIYGIVSGEKDNE